MKEAIRSVRNARAEHRVEPGRKIAATLFPGELYSTFTEVGDEFKFLARIADDDYEVLDGELIPPGSSISIVSGNISIFLPMSGLVDLEAERTRLYRELLESRDEEQRARQMLDNKQFMSKAPDAVVDTQRSRLKSAVEQIELLETRLAELG